MVNLRILLYKTIIFNPMASPNHNHYPKIISAISVIDVVG